MKDNEVKDYEIGLTTELENRVKKNKRNWKEFFVSIIVIASFALFIFLIIYAISFAKKNG